MCDQTYYREIRDAGETHLIVRALDASVSATDAEPPFAYPEWLPAASRTAMAGQIVAVSRILSDDSASVRRLVGDARRAVLVPWAHDSGCEPIPWMSAPIWIPPGTVGFVAARLRPRDKWAAGRPTFDVRDAWREPYTPARAVTALGTLAEGRQVMSAAEYGSFYASFPTLDAWTRDSRGSFATVLAWGRKHPALASKEPAATMLLVMGRGETPR